jgi:hypothetical protein
VFFLPENARRQKLAGLFLILALAAILYSIWLDREVYNALIDTFPPELKDDLTAKFALHGMALRRSTPLPIQRKYVGSLAAGAVFGLALSLMVFSFGETKGGWLLFGAFLICIVSVIKSWWTYKKNCAWQATRDGQETA